MKPFFKNLALAVKCITLLAMFGTSQANASVTLTSQNFDKEAETELSLHDQKSSTKSALFGDWLFNGDFANSTFTGFNPDYRISAGDKLLIQLWGGIEYQGELEVDVHGNIFIPKVGPVLVKGVENSKLMDVINKSVKRVYKSNVEVYATLATTEQVKVFVTGMVTKPGLYQGNSADSILKFIDLANGIKPNLGSYRNITVKRNGKSLASFDLYQFLNNGIIPQTQFHDGDVIFVGRKGGEIKLEGELGFTGEYEIRAGGSPLKEILNAVQPSEIATHVTLVSTKDKDVIVTQYSLSDAMDISVFAGTTVKISAQVKAQNISVTVLGEHNSEQEVVLPWGATYYDLVERIQFTPLSNISAIKLFRKSVAERQKAMLDQSLTALEQSVLTARSETTEAAKLRENEASTILQWVEKARQIEPQGQVLLSSQSKSSPIYLQQGDKIEVPQKRNLVIVHGEVLFPTSIAYSNQVSPIELIEQAGGALAEFEDLNILLMKPDGSVKSINDQLTKASALSAGDEIFVLAKPDEKSFQLTKDITQIIYQIAASAAVILAL